MTNNYKRSPEELLERATKRWPQDLRIEVAKTAPTIILHETFNDFVVFLESAPSNPTDFRKHIASWTHGFNLLLKHIMILSNFTGEQIKRLNTQKTDLIDPADPYLNVSLESGNYKVDLKAFIDESGTVDNKKLKIDGAQLTDKFAQTNLVTDLIVLLSFGAFSNNVEIANILNRCDLGRLYGNPELINEFLLSRYLDVNNSVQGSESNSLGQILQKKVVQEIAKRYTDFDTMVPNGKVTIDGHNITSDVLILKGEKGVGIEVAFQETTNSVIERKGTDAPARKTLLNKANIASAYVLDGIGNFERHSAITKICSNSDCTVAYSEQEFDLLVKFIREWLE